MVRLALALLTAGVLSDEPRTPLQKYTVNLDLVPEERFREPAFDHKNYLKAMVKALKLIFKGDAEQAVLNATVVSDESRREMQGVAAAAGVSYRDVLMANYFYELSSVSPDLPQDWRSIVTRSCTGIVAQRTNGSIYHARNQDYPPPFSPLQYDGTFVKNGKKLFEATTFAGIIGVGGTCMVPGSWSVSINARDNFSPSLQDAKDFVHSGRPNFPQLIRDACTRGGDFSSAKRYLSTTDMVNPGYIILAGAKPGEGAIITRNSTGDSTDVLMLEHGYPAEDPWFLVETNYDHWSNDTGMDHRRESGIKLMARMGQDNVDLDALWGVMSDTGKSTGVWPGVYNLATIHTELIEPRTGEYHTYLRHNIIEMAV